MFSQPASAPEQPVHQPLGRFGDDRSGREDFGSTRGKHGLEILWRDDAASDDDDVVAAKFFQRILEFGHQCQVASGQRRGADDVDVMIGGQPGDLVRSLEHRPDGYVETEIGEGGGDHLLAAVVAVLSHLGDQDARLGTVSALKRVDLVLHPIDNRAVAELLAVDTGNCLHGSDVPAEGFFQRQ